MSLTRTARLSGTSAAGYGTGSWTSGSFTPTANSLLVVSAVAIHYGGSGVNIGDELTISGGGLTYTKRVVANDTAAWGSGIVLFTAPVGASPSAMTLTLDCGVNSIHTYSVHVVDYTGYDTGSPAGATGLIVGGPTDGAASITLSAAPAIGSEVFATIYCSSRDASNYVAAGTGWTEIYVTTATNGKNDDLIFQSQVRTGSTSTSVGWDDVSAVSGSSLYESHMAAVEIKASGDVTAVASDTLTLSDAGVSITQRLSVASDTLTLSDIAAGEAISAATGNATDAVTLTDSALSVTERVTVAADALTLADSALSFTERPAVAADTITVSDGAIGEATSAVIGTASDTLVLSDNALSITERASVASDALVLTELASSFVSLIANASDAIIVSDSVIGEAVVAVFADAEDSVSLSDASLAELLYAGVGEDSLALSDSAVSFTERVSVAIDALALNDEAQSYTERLAAALDAIGFSDSATAANASSFVDLAYIEFALRARRVDFSMRSQLTQFN